MKLKLSSILLLTLCVSFAFGQSIELLVATSQGRGEWINSRADTWHRLDGLPTNEVIKAAGSYMALGTTIINVDTHEVTSVNLVWPETFYPYENRLQATTVDEDGNLWVLTGSCDQKVYRVDVKTGVMHGPFITVVNGVPYDNFEIFYNDHKLYVSVFGSVFVGEERTAALKSRGLVVISLPNPLSDTIPVDSVSAPVPPFQILGGDSRMRFDSEGRLYLMYLHTPIGTTTAEFARWDGETWESVSVTLSNTYVDYLNGFIFTWDLGYDDVIYVGGVFSGLNGQAVSNFSSFRWAENPTFNDLGFDLQSYVGSLAIDYNDDGSKSKNLYLALYRGSFKSFTYFDGTTETYTPLAPLEIIPPEGLTSMAASRVKHGSDTGSDDGSDVDGSDTGSDTGSDDDGSDDSGSDTGSDDNGSDAGSDDNGSNDGSHTGSDDNGSDSGSDDHGSDSGSDDNGSSDGSDSGSDDNGSDDGSDDNGSDDGSDDNGSDSGSDHGSDSGSGNHGSDSGSDDHGSDSGSDNNGSDSGSNNGGNEGGNIIVLGNTTGWIPGAARYSWGTGGSCGLLVSRKGPSNTRQNELIFRVISGGRPPKDWFGCGQYYYHTHNNTFLDFSGVSALRFWFKSNNDVTAKVEVEFDANTSPTAPNSQSNPGTDSQVQNPKKAFIYVSGTNGNWVQVTLPLSDRSSDELAHVYSPFIITVLGRGTVFIGNVEAVRN